MALKYERVCTAPMSNPLIVSFAHMAERTAEKSAFQGWLVRLSVCLGSPDIPDCIFAPFPGFEVSPFVCLFSRVCCCAGAGLAGDQRPSPVVRPVPDCQPAFLRVTIRHAAIKLQIINLHFGQIYLKCA